MNCIRKAISLVLASSIAAGASAQVSVITYHNDNLRSGLNTGETQLTQTNVNSNTFGLVFTLPVDGYVYAQPLYLPGQTIPGKGVHNVVYVATQHNSVYAFDADSNTGANATPLWHVNLGPSVPNGDTGSGDISPEIGITATPAILPGSALNQPNGTIYVVAKTKTLDVNNNPVYKNSLHALDVTTGAEKPNSPVAVTATVVGTGDGTDGTGHVPFNALIQNCRAGLLAIKPSLSSVKNAAYTIYMGFASHGDQGPYHGWLFAYNAITLQQSAVLNTTPNGLTDPSGYPLAAGGVWQSGAGLASDGQDLYFSTGNGKFDPTTGSYGDSVLKCALGTLSLVDYFSPGDQLSLDYSDGDLGSGGVMLLPKGTGSAANPNLMVQAGKEGTVYLLNTANLGKYNATTDQAVQELPQVMGGMFSCPAYFNGNIYFGSIFSSIISIPIKAGVLGTSPSSYSAISYGYPSPTPVVSANGSSNGIVWAIESDGYSSGGPANLQAYNANNLATMLYNSANTNGRDTMGPATKFAVPTVVNGKVYAGTGTEVDVFGLGQWVATPVLSEPSGNYKNSVTVQITDPTPGAAIYYTEDGSTPTVNSTPYTGAITLTSSTTLTARAFATGYGPSSDVQANYQINAVIGNGTGLTGHYYANELGFQGTATLVEVDPSINFNWGGGSPGTGVGGTDWACQWNGYIEAETTSVYTISTNSDDGVKVWVNGQLLINDWNDHGPTIDQATISLKSGGKYSIQIQYYQNQGGSLMQLSWAAPGMPTQIVPTTQLYPK